MPKMPFNRAKRSELAAALRLVRNRALGKRILLVPKKPKKTLAVEEPKGPRVRVYKTNHYPEIFIGEMPEKRKSERRSGKDRRIRSEHRTQWVSKTEPVWDDDRECYRIRYPSGALERRKIINYLPVEGGFLCITERRGAIERRGSVNRRKPENYRYEAVTNGRIKSVHGYATLRKMDPKQQKRARPEK